MVVRTGDVTTSDKMKTPTPAQIRQMIATWEKKTVDFKAKEAIGDPRVIPGGVLEKKDWKLARDVASFANTSGGYLIVGVEDKTRNIQDYGMSDRLKTRISAVLRRKIDPISDYEIENIRVGGRWVTAFIIKEGEGDLCTVNGTVYVRDVNGRAPATGAEITRLVRRRLGKKVTPTPTKRELVASRYNLPTQEMRERAMSKDFIKAARDLAFTNVTCVKQTRGRIRLASRREGDRIWHFLVIPFGDNFGPSECTAMAWIVGDFSRDKGLRQRMKGLRRSDIINALVLVLGRVNSLRTVLQGSGLSFVPTRFGGYVAPGSGLYHTFFLSGITSGQLMKERLEDLLLWLRSERDWLIPQERPPAV